MILVFEGLEFIVAAATEWCSANKAEMDTRGHIWCINENAMDTAMEE
jgi:hypothetical protein